jgi:PAS domain S-box-containing protein
MVCILRSKGEKVSDKGKGAAMGSRIDFTERKRDAERIERLSSAVEQSIDGIIILDLDWIIVYANNAVTRMYGYEPDELVGMKITDLNTEEEMPVYIKVKKYAEKHGSWSGEIQNKKKDGSVFPAFVSVTLLKDANGRPNGVLSLVRDISDQKKTEDKLLEVDRLKSEFVANTSHELRTPLQSVMGFTKLLLSGKVNDPAKQKEFLTIIDKQSEHLVMLIEDLIDVQRLESGRFHVDKSAVRIEEIIGEAVRELNSIASERGIDIKQQIAGSIPELIADGMRLKQVVHNILNNAVKFSHDDGMIWIKADKQDSEVLVQIIDQGIGIPKDAIGGIFERFHQVDGSLTRRAQGTGLGLYIVKQIVESHGGRVWVESVEGKGSTFSFILPIDSAS